MRKVGPTGGSWKGVSKGDATETPSVVAREVEAPKKKTRKKKDETADAPAAETETVAVVEEVAPQESVSESTDQTDSQ